MKVSEIVLGAALDPPRTLRVQPNPSGLTLVPVDLAGLAASDVAAAIRETLAGSERRTLDKALPFLRITAAGDDVEVSIADDAALGLRLLTETRPGGVPLLLEARSDEDVDAILRRMALASGTADPEIMLAGLAGPGSAAATLGPSPEASAYLDAYRRASALAKEVRAIDDRMTASVVPDWLWIATGLGGVGVFLTVIALLYPDLRIYVVPALTLFALLGFAAYGIRAFRELKVRADLQEQRRELRARREAARSEARERAAALASTGEAPETVLVGRGELRIPPSLPAIIGAARLGHEEMTRLAEEQRQTIVFMDRSAIPQGAGEDLIRGLHTIPAGPSAPE
jgi:hypothetical protein